MMAIREMNSKELHRFELLACLDVQLMGGQEPLEARLRSIPNGWRDYKLALTLVGKLVQKLYDTMPDKAIQHMVQLMRHGEAVVRMKPIGGGQYFQPVDVKDLKILINTCIDSECLICGKEGTDIRKCPLRRALSVIAPPVDAEKGECAYRYVVEHSKVGEYI